MVKIENFEKANLISLIIKNIIERNIGHPDVSSKSKKINATFLLKAGMMQTVLIFRKGEIIITADIPEKITARVEGSLPAFLKIALGKSMILPVITRKVTIKGNIFALLSLMKVLTVKGT